MMMSWTVAVVLLATTAIGLLADRWLGTSPWVVLLCTLVGTVLASFGVTRIVTREYGRLAPEADAPVPDGSGADTPGADSPGTGGAGGVPLGGEGRLAGTSDHVAPADANGEEE